MFIRSILLVSSLFLAASALPDTISVVGASRHPTIGQLTNRLTRLQHLVEDLSLIQATQTESNDDIGSDPSYGAIDRNPIHVTPEISRDWRDNEVAELQSPDEEKMLVVAGLATYGLYHGVKALVHKYQERKANQQAEEEALLNGPYRRY